MILLQAYGLINTQISKFLQRGNQLCYWFKKDPNKNLFKEIHLAPRYFNFTLYDLPLFSLMCKNDFFQGIYRVFQK